MENNYFFGNEDPYEGMGAAAYLLVAILILIVAVIVIGLVCILK